jgi:hypothetical protein
LSFVRSARPNPPPGTSRPLTSVGRSRTTPVRSGDRTSLTASDQSDLRTTSRYHRRDTTSTGTRRTLGYLESRGRAAMAALTVNGPGNYRAGWTRRDRGIT